jgi:hypothetical protein
MGLSQFASFEHGDFGGITYLDTFFRRGKGRLIRDKECRFDPANSLLRPTAA